MLKIETKNTSAIIRRFGADCPADQQYRELTQNGMDSIARAGRPGKVLWTFEERDKVRKVCVVDDGVGMTPMDVIQYINQLGSSRGTISDGENFGIGAKISAGVRNPAGVEYQTWHGGTGCRLLFYREGDNYGLRQFRDRPGDEAYYEILPESDKPDMIGKSGTKVVLHGNGPGHDTWAESRELLGARSDGGADHTGYWLIKYLNTRYWTVPDGTSVRVREQRTAEDAPSFCEIRGERHFLQRNSSAHGSVKLQDATVHWFVFPQKGGGGGEKHTTSPLVASVFQGELYDQRHGPSAYAALRNAGVFTAMGRVALVYEPDPSLSAHPNNVRTNLVAGGKALPYERWEEELSQKLPEAILELLKDLKVHDRSKDADERIQDIVSRIAPKRVVVRNGSAKAGPPDQQQPNVGGGDSFGPDCGPRPPKDGGPPPSGTEPTRPEGGGPSAARVGKFPIPDVVWVAADPPKGWDWVERREDGEMEEEAGCYIPSQCKIKMNADFKPIAHLVDDLMKEFRSARLPSGYIAREIHNSVGMRVKEMAAHVLAWNASSERWLHAPAERLKDSNITSAALSLSDAEARCRERIRAVLGKKRTRPKAPGKPRTRGRARPAATPSPTVQ